MCVRRTSENCRFAHKFMLVGVIERYVPRLQEKARKVVDSWWNEFQIVVLKFSIQKIPHSVDGDVSGV